MEFGLVVTAAVGLRAGDEIAATVGHSVIGGQFANQTTTGPVRTLSFEQGVRRLRTWGASRTARLQPPRAGLDGEPDVESGPVRSTSQFGL